MNWIKSLFRKQPDEPYGLSDIGVDMHSHLIPGIDDGSQSIEETLGMLVRFESLGYKHLITTPHVMQDHYKNTSTIILEGLEKVREAIRKHQLTITIDAAAEYYCDEFFIDRIQNNELLTFGNHYVLFEFSFSAKPRLVNEAIFALKNNGYQPVLAHFERYAFYLENGQKEVEDLKNRGVFIQMNLNSLTGHYGKAIRNQARMLVDNGYVDFVGSDCHRMEHLDILESNLRDPYFHQLKDLKLLNRSLQQ